MRNWGEAQDKKDNRINTFEMNSDWAWGRELMRREWRVEKKDQ